MRISWDASEVGDLYSDLLRVPAIVEQRNYRTVEDSAERVEKGWRDKATVTAGKHGWKYPKSIHAERLSLLEWKIEPTPGMDQAAMAFEYGGPSVLINITPKQIRRGAHAGQRVGQNGPHLDMNRTMDVEDPRFVKEAAGDVLPWW